MAITATKQTTSAFDKLFPQLQVVGSKIYYTWYEYDAVPKYQIWTAISDLDGSGFTPTKQTSSAFSKKWPQLQVVGSVIYYVWYESEDVFDWQIWTATSNLDGSSFTPTKQTTTDFNKLSPQLQVVGSVIYYVWYERVGIGGDAQIWTATSNLDGSSFTPTQQTTSAFNKIYVEFEVVGSTIYYAWSEEDAGADTQIWTATANLDGSSFTPTKQTTSARGKSYPQLQVVSSTIYYTWFEHIGADDQILTATSNLDGSSFTPTKQTTSAFTKKWPQLQVVGSVIYYAWYESDGADTQIWMATANLDGSGFTPTKQTTSAFIKLSQQQQVVGSTIYYAWYESDGADTQIWTGYFEIPPPPITTPTTTTDAATAVGSGIATTNGTLDDDGGEACDCGFEWGLTAAYGTATSTQSRTTGQTFQQTIGVLSPGTTYHFRAFATNSAGTGYGADRSFTTVPSFSRGFALSREEL